MKRPVKLLISLLLLFVVLVKPAMAQLVTPPCTPPQPKPNAAPPPVSFLVATHQCLLSGYNPASPNDYSQATYDLRQAGIGQLISGPDGLSAPQRVSILNDYAFWLLKQHDSSATAAANVLHVVVQLAPRRAVAWLNLGDALRAEMDSVSFPGGVYIGGTLSPTPEQKIALAKQALAAYRRYAALSAKPVRRVRDYLAALHDLQPPQAAYWSTLDAILHTSDAPHAAAVVLAFDDQPAAKLALAMDLGLFQPNPDKEQINNLLAAALPQDTPLHFSGFDGTVSRFIPYLQIVKPPYGEGNFPVACGMLHKYPELLAATQAIYGSSRDNFDPVIVCDDPRLRLPASVSKLDSDLAGPSGIGNYCGTMKYGVYRQDEDAVQLIQYAPRSLLPPFGASFIYVGQPRLQAGEQEHPVMQRLGISPDTIPLQAWGETDISSYNQAKQIDADFKRARTDLAAYYQSAFGFSAPDAEIAAFHAAWLVEGALVWAATGKASPLAEALLGHQPLAQVQAALTQESSAPAALLFDAVTYPEALNLLLAQHPNLRITTPIGKTVLMEAAKYNELESVKLLLAAGASVNDVSFAPGDVPDNRFNTGYGYPCGGFYSIYHGSRTALMYAAANASLPVINALLAAGADKTARDSTGATALDYLEGHGPVQKNAVLNSADFKTAEIRLKP